MIRKGLGRFFESAAQIVICFLVRFVSNPLKVVVGGLRHHSFVCPSALDVALSAMVSYIGGGSEGCLHF